MYVNSNVWYHIVNVNSNMMLEVPATDDFNARLTDGVYILQGDPFNANDASSWALWQFVPVSGGIYNILNKGSGRCMVIENGRLDNGGRCWQWKLPQERAWEQWRFSDVGRPCARHHPSAAGIRKPSQLERPRDAWRDLSEQLRPFPTQTVFE